MSSSFVWNTTDSSWLPLQPRTASTWRSRELKGDVTIPLYSVIFLLAVVGNLLVITTIVQNKRMRTITNVFLLNLSVSDLLLAVFCMPFTLVPTLMQDFVFGKAVCILVRYMQGVSVGVCVFTLVAISIERYFAVCHPLRSRSWQTLRHSYKTIACIWLISTAIMVPTAVCQRLVPLSSGAHKCTEVWDDRSLEKVYTIFLDIVLLAIPILSMMMTYGLIGITLFKDTPLSNSAAAQELRTSTCCKPEADDRGGRGGGRRSQRSTSSHEVSVARQRPGPFNRHDQHSNGVRAKRRTVKMLFVVVTEFFICWTPLYVLQTWSVFDYFGAVNNVSALAMNLIHLLAFVSSCCNPITYCFMSRGFREGFIAAFLCCPSCCKRTPPDHSIIEHTGVV